jgi:hypothetical protein
MTVARNQRNYPLVLKSDPINVGILSAFDWAAEDGSTTLANGKDHSGNNRNWTANATAPAIVSTPVGLGRDTSAGRTVNTRFYSTAGAVTLGMDRGTGDWSMFMRVRTPSVAPAATAIRNISRLSDSGGDKVVVAMYEILNNGWLWYVTIGGVIVLNWSTAGNPSLAANADSILHLTYTGGVCKAYVNGVLLKTTTGLTLNLLTTTGTTCVTGNYGSGNLFDFVFLDSAYWSRTLSDAEALSHAGNPYGYYENSAPANSLVITSPSDSTTVGVNITISGTYAGGDNPASIEASFNGGAYQTITASPGGGTFSGTLTGQTPGTGTLTVRWTDRTLVLDTVTDLTVSEASIAFTTPSSTQSVRPYRLFQRDAANQVVVRVSGTYTGSPTAIEYRWAGGAWTTLIASPSGSAFDTTITLQGPGQGTFELRHANNTAVTASVPYVSVGDLFIVGGQSNHVGMSGQFVEPAAPAHHTGWIGTMMAKDGEWKRHYDNSLNVFDDRTGLEYAVQTNASTPSGSYFGALSTLFQAAGVPVAFVPCALGSSSILNWAVSTSTSTLYGAMLARATEIGAHRAVLWWQGEDEAVSGGYTQAQFVTALNALVNDWHTRTGVEWFVNAINSVGTGSFFQQIHDAIIEVGQTNPNVLGYADLNGAFGSLHYNTSVEIGEIASRVFDGMLTAYLGIAAATSVQANGSEAGAIALSYNLEVSACSQSNDSSTGAIELSFGLVGAPSSQDNACAAGAVTVGATLTGSDCAQANQSGSAGITQNHILVGAACVQANVSSSGAVSGAPAELYAPPASRIFRFQPASGSGVVDNSW